MASKNYQAILNQLQVFGSPVFYEYDPQYPTPPPPGSPLAEMMAQMMNRDRGYGTLDEPDYKPRRTRGGQRWFLEAEDLFKILCSLTKICLNKPAPLPAPRPPVEIPPELLDPVIDPLPPMRDVAPPVVDIGIGPCTLHNCLIPTSDSEPDFKPRKTRGGQRNFFGNLIKIPLDILCSLTKICLNKPPGGGVGPMPGGPMPGGLMPGGPMPGGPMPGGLMPGRLPLPGGLPLPPNIPRADH